MFWFRHRTNLTIKPTHKHNCAISLSHRGKVRGRNGARFIFTPFHICESISFRAAVYGITPCSIQRWRSVASMVERSHLGRGKRVRTRVCWWAKKERKDWTHDKKHYLEEGAGKEWKKLQTSKQTNKQTSKTTTNKVNNRSGSWICVATIKVRLRCNKRS